MLSQRQRMAALSVRLLNRSRAAPVHVRFTVRDLSVPGELVQIRVEGARRCEPSTSQPKLHSAAMTVQLRQIRSLAIPVLARWIAQGPGRSGAHAPWSAGEARDHES